jgi:hypothetical protein
MTVNVDKQQSRSRSDSEYSTEPIIDSLSIPQAPFTRKRNHLSESEIANESTGVPTLTMSSSSAPPTPVPSLSHQHRRQH